MENVVYFLGAGFSAPLGLPVMCNFLEKARDMFFLDGHPNRLFESIFKTIKDLSRIKSYCSADLHNIEEVLSILEMQNVLSGASPAQEFQEFLKEVIQHYTPPCDPITEGELNGGVFDRAILGGRTWHPYGSFVASLCGMEMRRWDANGYPQVEVLFSDKPRRRYSVITVNYDMVLETALDALKRYGNPEVEQLKIVSQQCPDEVAPSRHIAVAKLHGSVDPLSIIPPTWNKRSDGQITGAWRLAYNLLVKANHIRIMGYSLPTSDAYVRYLFKASVFDAEHLKTSN